MKTKGNEAMRGLRRVIGRTQGEFAAMIGACAGRREQSH